MHPKYATVLFALSHCAVHMHMAKQRITNGCTADGNTGAAQPQEGHVTGAAADSDPAFVATEQQAADNTPQAAPQATPSPDKHMPQDTDTQQDNRLEIPPAPDEPCSPALQKRIADILKLQEERGTSMMARLCGDKRYRNPRFMEKIVDEMGIYKYGTCFCPEVFDPRSFPPEDYLPAIRKQLEEQVRRDA